MIKWTLISLAIWLVPVIIMRWQRRRQSPKRLNFEEPQECRVVPVDFIPVINWLGLVIEEYEIFKKLTHKYPARKRIFHIWLIRWLFNYDL